MICFTTLIIHKFYLWLTTIVIIGGCILKFIKSEINKVKAFSTDMVLTFGDKGVSKKQYAFLKKRLDQYNWYIDDDYSMISETLYEESSEVLLIAMVIIIPDRLMPKNNEVLTQIITENINRFPKFYERITQQFNPDKEKESYSSPSYTPWYLQMNILLPFNI